MVIATGVSYRLLEATGSPSSPGRGVFYGAAANDAPSTEGSDVYIVGAANSAGQAALHLARTPAASCCSSAATDSRSRCRSTSSSASQATANIDVRLRTEVVRGGGDDHLERLVLADTDDRRARRRSRPTGCTSSSGPSRAPTGSATRRPRQHGLRPHRARRRGPRRVRAALAAAAPPLLLETSRPGVFAAGDVRLASMKRVASAVGEGSSAVSIVHLYLETV